MHILLAATAALSTLLFSSNLLKKGAVGSGASEMTSECANFQPRPQNLQSQLEYYFSDDYLHTDANLRSSLSSLSDGPLMAIAVSK